MGDKKNNNYLKGRAMKGFITFVREQGVVGLAVGFILGGAVSKVVSSLVSDVINPLIGGLLGGTESLSQASVKIGSVQLMWGSFVNTAIDFIVIALVVYYGVKLLKLDKLDAKKK